MTIKKAYIEVVKLLEDNANKKVSVILDDVRALCEAKTQQSTTMYDAKGKLIAIFCYYHKQWELISEVEYGKKTTSKTGLNTMCKVGTSLWTKQQTTAKKAESKLLEDVAKGEVPHGDLLKLKEDIEANRNKIDKTNLPKGFASEAEVVEHLAKTTKAK